MRNEYVPKLVGGKVEVLLVNGSHTAPAVLSYADADGILLSHGEEARLIAWPDITRVDPLEPGLRHLDLDLDGDLAESLLAVDSEL